MKIQLTPFWWRIIGYVVAAILIYVAFQVWLSGRDEKQNLTATTEQQTRTAEATAGISKDSGEATQSVGKVEVIVTDARAAYQLGAEDAKRQDPSIAVWADSRVPARMRELARQRRLDRERLGRDGSGSPSPPAETEPGR